jgi:hypothetical protein
MKARLEEMGLDIENVVDWEKRPRRARKPAPLTYWEEYVATDPWYLRELTADIPEDEYDAAVNDEDWENDESSDVESISDASDSECEGWIDESGDCPMGDAAYETDASDATTDDVSDDCSDCSDASEDCATSGEDCEEPPAKRQRRG